VSKVTLNLQPLQKLQEQLGEFEVGRVQVGLFQETAGRSADKGRIADNPTLGKVHEFGQGTIPERSFLRMPLTLHLAPTLGQKNWVEPLRKIGAKRTLGIVGAVAEDVVQESFATRGWGAWPDIKPETKRRKKSSAILIESGQLRKAVSSRVV